MVVVVVVNEQETSERPRCVLKAGSPCRAAVVHDRTSKGQEEAGRQINSHTLLYLFYTVPSAEASFYD